MVAVDSQVKTLCLALLFVLTGCSQPVVSPTRQPVASETNPPPPTAVLPPSPTPSLTPVVTGTPVPRWVEYQAALARAIHPDETGILCEWELLGQRGREVYVWARCFNEYRSGAAPAVIELGTDGRIEKVTLPRDGSYYSGDVRRLFPPEVQQKLFAQSFGSSSGAHARARMKDPSLPPFIAVSGTPLP